MYNLNRVVGGIEISVENTSRTSVTGGIEISLENYSDSRFLLLLPLSAQTDKGLKLWFPAREQKISLVPAEPHNPALLQGSLGIIENPALLKGRMSKIGYNLHSWQKWLNSQCTRDSLRVLNCCFWELWELSYRMYVWGL